MDSYLINTMIASMDSMELRPFGDLGYIEITPRAIILQAWSIGLITEQ